MRKSSLPLAITAWFIGGDVIEEKTQEIKIFNEKVHSVYLDTGPSEAFW